MTLAYEDTNKQHVRTPSAEALVRLQFLISPRNAIVSEDIQNVFLVRYSSDYSRKLQNILKSDTIYKVKVKEGVKNVPFSNIGGGVCPRSRRNFYFRRDIFYYFP